MSKPNERLRLQNERLFCLFRRSQTLRLALLDNAKVVVGYVFPAKERSGQQRMVKNMDFSSRYDTGRRIRGQFQAYPLRELSGPSDR